MLGDEQFARLAEIVEVKRSDSLEFVEGVEPARVRVVAYDGSR
jgi:hypothetical protein